MTARAKTTLSEIEDLSLSERLQRVQDIWDSIAAEPGAVPVTEVQRKELERRLEAHERDPQGGRSWSEPRPTTAQDEDAGLVGLEGHEPLSIRARISSARPRALSLME